MREVEFLAPTKRRSMSKGRVAKIFLREKGRCYLCSRVLRVGADTYEIEHPDALSLGGSDDDAELRVVCVPCHKVKTKQDRKAIAKRDRIVADGYAGRKSSRPLPGTKASGIRKRMNGQVERWT